jgi:hypothetical protein
MRRAREAMVALQNAGIGAGDIGLVGENAKGASRRSRRRRRDKIDNKVAQVITSRSINDSVLLGAIGAGAGLVVGVILGAATGAWALLPITIVALALVGGVAGTKVGVERALGPSDSWQLPYHDPSDGSVWVAVYAGDIGTANDVVESAGAAEVRRPADLDALGRLFTGIDTGRRPA